MLSKPPCSRVRLFQFSLRWLFVAILVVAAYFGGRAPLKRELEETQQELEFAKRREEDAREQAQRQLYRANIQLARQQMQAAPPVAKQFLGKEWLEKALDEAKDDDNQTKENQDAPSKDKTQGRAKAPDQKMSPP